MRSDIDNWASKRSSSVYKTCAAMYSKITKLFDNREDADNDIQEAWDVYNCVMDDNQIYRGNSNSYVPAVRDAINAEAKRTLKQLFPNKYRHVTAVSAENQSPDATLAILEHYIRTTNLKSIVRSMLISGRVTGQWGIMVDWQDSIRHVKGAVRRNPVMSLDGGKDTLELVDPNEEEEVEDESDVDESGPEIIDFDVRDLAVIPPTARSIAKAEITALKLRMSKAQVEDMVERGIFYIRKGTDIDEWMKSHKGKERKNVEKEVVSGAGIRTDGVNEYALIYWAQAYIKFDGDQKELADIYFAGEDEIVGIIKAPQWNQRRSIISAPVYRKAGSFYGESLSNAVKSLQWNLNTFWNLGQDSAMYSQLPIVMTDPEKNPNYAMMVIGLAAVWPTSPQSTQFVNFPQLWKDAEQMCAVIKAQIQESLDVNPMMMGVTPKGRKNNQMIGMLQQEQSVSITDNAERFEDEILNPLIEILFEYDQQYRDKEKTVITLGQLGQKSTLETIPPFQWGERYFLQWTGTDFINTMQMTQQRIAMMNVLRGIPPQLLNGLTLDITPIVKDLVSSQFGPELSMQILVDNRNKYTVDPHIENEMMVNGIMAEVHPADDDQAHIQAHQQAAQITGDTTGLLRTHMERHLQSLIAKRQAAQPQQQGTPGAPPGAGQGLPGTPRPGALPAPSRPVQNPPGAIQQDNMPGAPGRG